MKRFLFALWLLFGFVLPAQAQTGALVVTTCGTLPLAYAPGATRPVTINVNGQLCNSSTGGGGGAVDLTGINGVAPDVGAGNSGTGTLRVVISSNNPAVASNLTTVAGVSVDTGNGTAGTGTQRVAISSNNTPFSVNAIQSTSPWIISGTVTSVSGSVTSTQGTSPWVVSGTVTPANNYGAAQLTSALFNSSASGDNTTVTRVTGTIKIYGGFFACSQATTATLKNGTGTNLTGAMPLTTFFLPVNTEPYFTTTSTNNFVLNLGNTGPCNGTWYYKDS